MLKIQLLVLYLQNYEQMLALDWTVNYEVLDLKELKVTPVKRVTAQRQILKTI